MQKIISKMPAQKTIIDCALFAATIFVVYEFGKDIAKVIEDVVPTEEGIMKMMQEQQA
jgi:hypothetical protein